MLCFRMEFTLFLHSALLQEIKVLVVAHNIPTRLFPDWYVAVAPSPVTSPQRTAEPQPTAELVAELLALLLTLAAGVQSSEVTPNNQAVRHVPGLAQNPPAAGSSRARLPSRVYKAFTPVRIPRAVLQHYGTSFLYAEFLSRPPQGYFVQPFG